MIGGPIINPLTGKKVEWLKPKSFKEMREMIEKSFEEDDNAMPDCIPIAEMSGVKMGKVYTIGD